MQDIKGDVETTLDKIRSALRAEGGDVKLVGIDNGVVKVKLQGSCAGCPFSQMTIKNFIEKELKKSVPGVRSVEAV